MKITLFTFLSALILAGCSVDPTVGQAEYELAVRHLEGVGVAKDIEKGVEYLMKSSDMGNAQAELALGYMYIKGKNVPQDVKKGTALFKSAAKKGNSDAQYNVGLAYVRGEVLKKDYAEGLKWFEKAALQDDAGAQYNLGVMYANGEGVVRDPVIAYVWFKLANDKGYEGTKEAMEGMKNSMTSDQMKDLDTSVEKIASQVQPPKPVLELQNVEQNPSL